MVALAIVFDLVYISIYLLNSNVTQVKLNNTRFDTRILNSAVLCKERLQFKERYNWIRLKGVKVSKVLRLLRPGKFG